MRTDSPEDRLLRLIKGKYKKKSEGESPPSPSTDKLITEPSKKIFMKNKVLRPLFSDSVNRVLAIILLVLVGYLGYSMFFPAYRNLDSFIEGVVISPEATNMLKKEKMPLASSVDDYSIYSKAIQGKKLFSAPFVEEEDRQSQKEPEIDISRRFNLVGIIAGEQPQAIIEDKEMRKTHYLYEGQTINSVSVKEIKEGRVVLEYKGKEVMLVL